MLSAGSLALAVSGAVALYQKPLPNGFPMHWGFLALEISASCLWLSLISSIAHNLLEAYAMHLLAKARLNEAVLELIDAVLPINLNDNNARIKKYLENEITRLVPKSTRISFLRKCEMPLSITAACLLAAGYFCVVGYITVLAKNF